MRVNHQAAIALYFAVATYNPNTKNKYGYPGPLPNHHSFSVLILKLLKPSAFLFSEFSFFFESFL
jgi:hypothetical protein